MDYLFESVYFLFSDASSNADSHSDTQTRYLIIFVVNVLICSFFNLFMIIFLIFRVTCQFQWSARIVVISFSLCFILKAMSDWIRYASKVENQFATFVLVNNIVNHITDRVKLWIIYYFAFMIREVKLKIEAQTIEEYKGLKLRHKKRRMIIFITFLILQTAIFINFMFRFFDYQFTTNSLGFYFDLAFRILMVILELVMVVEFLSNVKFLKKLKIQRLEEQGDDFTNYHKFIFLMIQILSFLHLIYIIVDVNYPLGLIITEGYVQEITNYAMISEYIGFIVMAIIDFLLSLGFIFLYYKVGR